MKSSVFFGDERLKDFFDRLQHLKSEDKRLYGWLVKAFWRLEDDCFCGTQITKRMIPKFYIDNYGIDNLWKYNLPNGWRLIYSVTDKEGFVNTLVLEWLPHSEYEKRFNY